MKIVLSNTSEHPIYQQIFEQLSSQIIRGELESDAALPPIRTTAKELRVSIITVKKAWELLERGGFIYTVVGRGSFVAPLSAPELNDKRDSMVMDRLKKDVEYYRKLGLSVDELVEVIRELY